MYLLDEACLYTQTYCWLLPFLSPSLTQSIRPTEVQKVAGVALLTTHQQKANYNPPNSFSTTAPFLPAPWMTKDILHVPNIRHMWLFQRPTTWCHLCAGAHLLTLTLFLVFFPLHIYMESVVCLCSVLWGVSVPLFKRDIKQSQRGTWWFEHDRDGYFLSSYSVTSRGSHFSCFLLMENLIIRQKKEVWHRCHHFFWGGGVKCFHSPLVNSSDVEGVKGFFFPKHTSFFFLAHPTCS